MRFFTTCLLFAFAAANAYKVVGANNSLEAVQGAKSAAVGGAALALDSDLPSLVHNPLQLSNIVKSSIAFTHVAYFEGTSYNGVVMALPLIGAGTLGFAASRFGAGDIPYIKENDPLPEGESYNTLSISDWLLTSAWGRSFGKLNLALSMHLLKRELDQSGWGFRSDIAAGYEFSKRFVLAGIVKGWAASSVRWESGHFEYSNPEFYAAFKFSEPFPYFYGKLNAYWQSAGVSEDWLSASSAGLEFETDFSFSLRAGLAEVNNTNGLALGAGIKPTSWLSADYAFQMHQVLSSVHRISVTASF
ncbi:MAG: hypothetical protein LBC85_10610 [Fibromonadaceae bacterium]|jgi:hypothetical protein|nr:hypothetical protein [Fibromonadaceae bacterium]